MYISVTCDVLNSVSFRHGAKCPGHITNSKLSSLQGIYFCEDVEHNAEFSVTKLEKTDWAVSNNVVRKLNSSNVHL
jgi:hypothetical protein